MKVLIIGNLRVINTEDGGMVANFVTDQMAAIKKCHPEVEIEYYLIKGYESKWNYIKSLFEIKKLIKCKSFDVVHIHHGLSAMFLLFGIKPKMPVILTMHGGDIQPEQGNYIQVFITHQVLKHVDYAITLNERMDGMVKKYCKNTMILPCSINMEYFNPKDKKHLGEKTRIIFGSSPSRTVKDYPLYHKTVELLKSKYGYDVEEVWFDNISKAQVKERYLNSDLLLLTSISEGSPGVIKEAMACNQKIVSTNVGDVANNLKGVKNAAVSKEHDANELAGLCDKCLKDQISGKEGRERLVELELDDQSITDKLINLYHKLSCR